MGFSLSELSAPSSLLILPPVHTRPPLPASFPSPPGCRLRGREGFHLASRYYSAVRLLIRHRFPFRLPAYRVTYCGATRKPHESSWSHAQIFRTVPSANTLVRWVNENAFASIMQARPCPIFGRPVHQRGSPLDYGPVLLRMPFGFHLTMDTLPSGCLATERELRSFPLAVSTVSSYVPV